MITPDGNRMGSEFDCVVCGEICVDLTIGPIDRSRPLAHQQTARIEPVSVGTGGIVSNSGLALACMQQKSIALGCIGTDNWGQQLESQLVRGGLDTSALIRVPECATSVTAIFVDETGEHNFAFHAGASAEISAQMIRDAFPLLKQSAFILFGYYGLFQHLHDELPGLLKEIQRLGCRTALDAAAGGGSLEPLNRMLPHLDVYVPSREEALAQTGQSDPREMIRVFRKFAPNALLGVKLGAAGALLSPSAEQWIEVAPLRPPAAVVDTTGAGDCFYAGLLTALNLHWTVEEAGRLAAAAGAYSVTARGATVGLPDFDELRRMADL